MVKLLFKRVLAIAAGTAALAGAVYLAAAWDRGASHPGLAASDLPPLIPVRAFYADPQARWGFSPSFDGKLVYYEKGGLRGGSLRVREVASGREIAVFPVPLYNLRWHPERPLLRFVHEGREWEADPYNAAPEKWAGITPQLLKYGWPDRPLKPGWHSIALPARGDQPLPVLGRKHSRSRLSLYHVSQDGKELTRIEKGSESLLYWWVDEAMQPLLRFDNIDDTRNRMLRRSGREWVPVLDYTVNDLLHPVSRRVDGGSLLFLSNRGRDTAALVRMDLETGQETVLHERPGADVFSSFSLGRDGTPDVVVFHAAQMTRVALTARGRAWLDVLDRFPAPVHAGNLEISADGRFAVFTLSPQEKSLIHVLADLQDGSHQVLEEDSFRRFARHLSRTREVSFAARDGLEIPALLTWPEGAEGAIPFVVMVHGGPADADRLGYDHFKQFLANRGYGVLSVNFRGSTGYGRAFQEKGFRQFGRAMQDDVADAALWLAAEGLADPEAIAVMGDSYGGYAALMAVTRDPGLFAAAVAGMPMTDVEFQTRYHPSSWRKGFGAWTRYFGELENPQDLAAMRRYSPVNRAEQISSPILLTAGLKDQVTGHQQVRDFEAAARAAGKEISAHYFEQGGHSLQRWQDRLARARLVEDFLAQHLGGRSGRFDYAELGRYFSD